MHGTSRFFQVVKSLTPCRLYGRRLSRLFCFALRECVIDMAGGEVCERFVHHRSKRAITADLKFETGLTTLNKYYS